MIKDNEDHVGWLVQTPGAFYLFENPDEADLCIGQQILNSHSYESPCLYNWNRGQCIIRLPHQTITLCDLENASNCKISRSIIVKNEVNDIGV